MNDTTGRRRGGRRRVLGTVCAVLLLGCGQAAGQAPADVVATPAGSTAALSVDVAELRLPDDGVLSSLAATADRTVGVGAADRRAAVWALDADGAWTRQPVPAVAGVQRLDAVALAGGSGVAFGGDGQRPSRLWVVDDAATWRVVDADVAGIDGRVNAVTAAGDRWIAVGDRVDPEGGESYRGTVWASDDGRSFTPVTSDLALAEGTLSDVAATGDAIVVVGFDTGGGRVWSATDDGAFDAAAGPFEGSTVEGVAVADGGFVALGRGVADLQPRTWTSDDGRRWQRADVESGDIRPDDRIHDLTTVNGVVVAVGGTPGGGVLWTLEDGSAWRRHP